MAQRVVTLLIDDLTGEESEDVSNVQFSVAGSDYEIDLNSKNREEFMRLLEPYVKNARQVKRGRKPSGRSRRAASSGGRDETPKIREWAKKQGYEVSNRGRVPANIREAYRQAH